MSEAMERSLENGAPETAEDKEKLEQQEADERENAPREDAKPGDKKEEKGGKNRKKRRKKGVALPAVAALLVIALAFGAVIGYGYGRSVGARRLVEAEKTIATLAEALEEAQSMPVYDVFDEELSEANQSALNDLAGNTLEDDGVASALMGEDSLEGASGAESTEAPVVVAEYNGGQIMSDEAAREYSEQMAGLVFAGYSEEEVAETLLDEVLRSMVGDRILADHAREMGLYDLTDADRAEIEKQAQRNYDEQLEFHRDYVNTDGMTDEEATGAVKAYLQQNEGVTLDTIRQELESIWWVQKLYDEVTKDVTVDEAALQAAYDEKLAQQKESFSAYPDDFEFAQMNGETIVYNLPGYRAVRMLLIELEDAEAIEAVSMLMEERAQLNPQTDAQRIAEYTAEIDGYYAAADEKALGALNEIQAGADFIDVLSRAGMDEGMKDETLLKTGYYVSQDSLLWPQEVISAAMALENPGDVSGVVRLGNGVCILEYVGDVQQGDVALEDVRDALMEETIESAKYSAYEARLNQWIEDANVVYHPERMQ